MTRVERVTAEEDQLIEVISPERFRPFLAACGGDRVRALRLYAWDSEAARALHSPLRDLEVSLRNRVHRRLVERAGQEDWWGAPKTRPNEAGQKMLAGARSQAQKHLANKRPRRTLVPCDVVAQLSFGFWVSLFGKGGRENYEMRYWNPSLRHMFPQYRDDRKAVYSELDFMRTLRNRIAHHESVFQRHLDKDLETMLGLLRCVSPEMAARHEKYGQVPEVLARRAAVLSGRVPIRL